MVGTNANRPVTVVRAVCFQDGLVREKGFRKIGGGGEGRIQGRRERCEGAMQGEIRKTDAACVSMAAEPWVRWAHNNNGIRASFYPTTFVAPRFVPINTKVLAGFGALSKSDRK